MNRKKAGTMSIRLLALFIWLQALAAYATSVAHHLVVTVVFASFS